MWVIWRTDATCVLQQPFWKRQYHVLLTLCHRNFIASDEICVVKEFNAPLFLVPQLVNAKHES